MKRQKPVDATLDVTSTDTKKVRPHQARALVADCNANRHAFVIERTVRNFDASDTYTLHRACLSCPHKDAPVISRARLMATPADKLYRAPEVDLGA